jgi:hypothetical protein
MFANLDTRIAAWTAQAQADAVSLFRFVDETEPSWWSKARHVAVLDASFNPPTRAHLQLILDTLQQSDAILGPTAGGKFDGFIVLFASKNVDKGQSSDASIRFALMERLVRHCTAIDRDD